MTGRLVRLAEASRPKVSFTFDGAVLTGLEGDSVLTAILMSRDALRQAEFGPEQRSGFCLMGACQDCWIWQSDGARLRACSTVLQAGMRLQSAAPDKWPVRDDAP
ncbi:(2Fe-2S)-binding protein [Pseudosulfitobacter pseudonitzschiae]|uniref:(2Fe-2S)-binding protein n=1 Tax=Pseudosulfitobacter pseudonitzschiae TaxID=1402135 RepID=UPI001AF6E38D|nr:(2Fe-2S)-binding protein [Pseudosulfitobacter pseudonitzschiae]MBM1815809.1 (2Fe-2S)-binding protein [Pseudosulfitobacter pseudonitzschiae]MBM1832800.1 (2Fe-2S)-binding protein [Pseudosulfitobacter pseudonitzschiae]MBM1837668.1 (2Fe-2S)-binding protein [Pseudosulfitobacter pseudonitzschiae]MBM1842514.1 (2Fe-2S)-binding protein [Pseudosulfitobacter pseudonitzschiae]MBM1847382.1 (2Fe-2S)-binding protein [Pseudosulfitobacter pseudonitzschiae]